MHVLQVMDLLEQMAVLVAVLKGRAVQAVITYLPMSAVLVVLEQGTLTMKTGLE